MMAQVKWIKICTDIFDDEKILLIETLPEADSIIVIWFKLLCLAGKQNNNGVFMMNDKIPYTEKMLATIFRRKETTIQLALNTFEQFGMIEIVNGVVTIPNWGKHQSFDKIEKNNEYMRNYMREYRANQKLLTQGNLEKNEDVNINSKLNGKVNSKVNVSALEKEKELEEDIDIEEKENTKEKEVNTRTSSASCGAFFDSFWKSYPKKKGKDKCLRWFKTHKVTEELLEEMLQAIEEQKKSKDWQKDNGQFIPYPYTWLNQGRWKDEVEEEIKVNNQEDWLDDWYKKVGEIKYS